MSQEPRPAMPAPLSTTGIGSLPHTQLEMGMQQALLVDLPYLPQLPMKDPAEFMIPQALEGLPGFRFDREGNAAVDRAAWERGAASLDARLERALETGRVESFEPSAAFSCAWRPFLWEVEHRALPFAKVQCTGPITARWAARLEDGRPVSEVRRLEQQILRLTLARAIAMARAVRERGATPLVFLDEPALSVLERKANAAHAVLFEELRIAVRALQKQGALVGLHCCGNADWAPVLSLGLDVLSTDARLSLGSMLASGEALSGHLDAGGWLALGIVPTDAAAAPDIEDLVRSALGALGARPGLLRRVLGQSLLTPACGLALRTVPECERTFEDLRRAQELTRAAARGA